MKSKIIAFTALLTLASFASAKITYVTGDVKHIDREKLQIAIVKNSGAIKSYKINPEAISDLRKVKAGDSVTLELETAKLEK